MPPDSFLIGDTETISANQLTPPYAINPSSGFTALPTASHMIQRGLGQDVNYYSISTPAGLNPTVLKAMAVCLLINHPILRTRWSYSADGQLKASLSHMYNPIEICGGSAENFAYTAEDFDLGAGKVMRMWWFVEEQKLVIGAHALAVDYRSWHIIHRDLVTMWHQTTAITVLQPEQEAWGMRNWVSHVTTTIRSRWDLEWEYWNSKTVMLKAVAPSFNPIDVTLACDSASVTLNVTGANVSTLGSHDADSSQLATVLIWAYAKACAMIKPTDGFVGISVLDDGRSCELGVDMRSVVGLFEHYYPVYIPVGNGVGTSRIQLPPLHGLGYGFVANAAQHYFLPRMSFAYRRTSRLRDCADWLPLNNIPLQDNQGFELSLSCTVSDTQVQLDCHYDPQHYQASQINQILSTIVAALEHEYSSITSIS